MPCESFEYSCVSGHHMARKRLAAIVLAAALSSGCGPQPETKRAQATVDVVADGASQSADEVGQVEERPYEFRDIFPDGREPLHKKPSGEPRQEVRGSMS